MTTLTFDEPPATPWLRLVLKRTRWAGTLPDLQAVIEDTRLAVPAAYRDLCGLTGEGMPVTWPFVAASPLHKQIIAHPDFPLAALGLVHVTQTCATLRPLDPDAPVTLRVRLAGHTPAKRGVEVALHTAVEDAAGVAWEGQTTFLSQAVSGDGVDRPADDHVPEAPAVETRLDLPADLGRRYGRVAGDLNPIHLYAWTARPFGFRRAIVHGMWTAARALAAVDPAADRLEVRFRRPLLLPGVAHVRADADGTFAVVAEGRDKPALVGRIGG